MLDEQAKAIGAVVKVAGGIGKYLANVVGSIPEDLLGLVVGDWLQHKRRRHLAVLTENTRRILESVEVERITEPNPSVLIPILQAAADEAEPELQAMWAGLIANAMLDGGRRARLSYIKLLKELSPSDASYLAKVPALNDAWVKWNSCGLDPTVKKAVESLPGEERVLLEMMRSPSDEELISRETLIRHGCITPRDRSNNWSGLLFIISPPILTAFGRGLLAACTVTPTPDGGSKKGGKPPGRAPARRRQKRSDAEVSPARPE